MNAAALLVRLYPPAVRERWGGEIAFATQAAGMRSWLDTAAGAAKLWLRPSDWPEVARGDFHRIIAAALVAVVAAAALLLRASSTAGLGVDVGDLVSGVWGTAVLIGLFLAVPVPPLRPAPFRRAIAAAVRLCAAPGLAFLALVLIAHSGLMRHPVGWAHGVLIGYYWVTLAFMALRLCAAVAHVGRVATTPSTRRLSAAFVLAGLVFASAQTVLVRAAEGLGVACGLAFLGTVVLVVALGLGRIGPPRGRSLSR